MTSKPADYIDLSQVIVTKEGFVRQFVTNTLPRLYDQIFTVAHLVEIFDLDASDHVLAEVGPSQLASVIRLQLEDHVKQGDLKVIVAGKQGRTAQYRRTARGTE